MTQSADGGIRYLDTTAVEWSDAGPGSKRLVLKAGDGLYVALVRWEAGFQLPQLDEHGGEEIVYVLDGTFVDENETSPPQTIIHSQAGTSHRPSTPDGVTFLVVRTLGGDEASPAPVTPT